jgi:hypothetical protein
MGWRIHQMDVKTAFPNGIIKEEVYIEKPEDFETFNRESHVCRLKRELYGMKQAPYSWYTRIDSYFTGLGFTKSEADANLYQIVVEGKILIIVLYVDDSAPAQRGRISFPITSQASGRSFDVSSRDPPTKPIDVHRISGLPSCPGFSTKDSANSSRKIWVIRSS